MGMSGNLYHSQSLFMKNFNLHGGVRKVMRAASYYRVPTVIWLEHKFNYIISFFMNLRIHVI